MQPNRWYLSEVGPVCVGSNKVTIPYLFSHKALCQFPIPLTLGWPCDGPWPLEWGRWYWAIALSPFLKPWVKFDSFKTTYYEEMKGRQGWRGERKIGYVDKHQSDNHVSEVSLDLPVQASPPVGCNLLSDPDDPKFLTYRIIWKKNNYWFSH